MNAPSGYDVRIIRRSFDQIADDYHATITRRSDGKQLILIAAWRWLLRWRVRPAAIRRAFAAQDRYERKLVEAVEEYRVEARRAR